MHTSSPLQELLVREHLRDIERSTRWAARTPARRGMRLRRRRRRR
jgi:hypothetical protein